MNNDRQTGRTSRQMKDAPQGAVYVWCNNVLRYPKDLANRLGRTDLKVISLDGLEEAIIGTRNHVVVDHFANLSERQIHALQIHEAKYKWQ